ncbi:MAG: flippase-like domain-containing protein [Myxococcales bacterium]|nr:flippase-like domain-containing protein [Myxococcales bacterium]MCB9702021.1 flippase-like domain-containing protein [Myxococcales bacterium]
MGRSTGKRWWLRLIASLVIAGAALVIASRRVGTIPDSFAVPWWTLPAYVALLVVYFLTRAWRWTILVRAIAPVERRLAIDVALAGFLWIILLPWRLGELARPILMAHKAPIGASEILGTVAIERITDGLVVCGLFFVTLAAHRERAEVIELQAIAATVSGLFLGALLVVLAMALWPRFAGALARRLLRRIHPGLAERLGGIADGIADGLRALPSARPLVAFAGATALYWGINAVGMWFLARGCGMEITLVEATAVMTVFNLALLVPGAPGHLGTFQLGILGGLAIFVPREVLEEAGVRYAFYLYTTQIGMCVLLGVWSQSRLQVPWRGLLARLVGGGDERSLGPSAGAGAEERPKGA